MIRVIVAKAGALAVGGRIPAVGDEPCEQRRQMSDRCCPYGARKDIVSANPPDRVCGDAIRLLKSEAGPHTLFPIHEAPVGESQAGIGTHGEILLFEMARRATGAWQC
jgi:hypothetical protein